MSFDSKFLSSGAVRKLGREGFRHVFILSTPEEIDAAILERVPLYNDKRSERGPFDIIGDIHGCCDELETLLQQLGYVSGASYSHPEGRKAIFLGDLVDRGPRILDAVRLVQIWSRLGPRSAFPAITT